MKIRRESPGLPGSAAPPAEERLHWLAQRGAEGILDPREAAELAALLSDSGEAREVFAICCQLHAALEHEPALQESLAASGRPANVVSIPGSRPVLARGPEARPSRRSSAAAWLAGAAALLAALALAAARVLPGGGGEGLDRVKPADQPSQPYWAGAAAEHAAPAEEAEPPGMAQPSAASRDAAGPTPEEQYLSSPLLAKLAVGSESRPPAATVNPAAATRVSFNRDIRPLLSDNCFHCHGPDEESRKAGLRLDLRQAALASETNPGAPVAPGDPGASELYLRLTASDPGDLMPPPDSHKALSPAEIALFRRWIEEGAAWEEHWAFVAPLRAEVPDDTGSGWARGGIDRFLEARLAAEGLEPSEQADRYTLIRRATLDLTGLPPTPEEIAAFLADESPGAYETLLDRLLGSRAYGEHRARTWLDGARYGDTHGLHLDNYREIWPYRDWVIGAFNGNLPYDRFTIEQIAGDLLESPGQDQLVATGFNRCNVTTSEGGAIAEEFLARYAVDRVATTATVWMGLTAGCAQCHNHKYDPLSMREFYQLYAFFNNTTQPGMDGNAKDSPPVIRVFADPADRDGLEAAEAARRQAESDLQALAQGAGGAELDSWLAGERLADQVAALSLPGAILEKSGPVGQGGPEELGRAGDFAKARPFTVAFRYQVESSDGSAVLLSRTDPGRDGRGWRVTFEDQGFGVQLVESWPVQTLRTGTTRRVRDKSSGHFAVTYDGSGHSRGMGLYLNGQRLVSRFVNEWLDTVEDDFQADAPLRAGLLEAEGGAEASLSDLRLYDRRLTDPEVKLLHDLDGLRALAGKPAEQRDDKESGELRAAWLAGQDAAYREALARLSAAESAVSAIEARTPVTLVMQEKEGSQPSAFILDRGEYDQPLDEVEPGTPAFLPPMPEGAPANRLGLALWIASGDNPLTARVAVNRAWQELFGTGLVKTSEDFGTQGEPPSHPELLDWLAVRFAEEGWDLKALYREIMLSAAYRQSARAAPGQRQRDPENRLLARGPRFRLDAEVLRDQALAAGGLLDPAVGGRSVRPWQPGGIWEAVGYTNSNTQTFYPDYGAAAEHRRSLYTFWKRTAPPPNLAVFDAPDRESCSVRRERTNTPLQALVLMNDPQFVRAARHIARRVVEESEGTDQRIDRLSLLLTGRPRQEEEKQVLRASLAQFENAWGSDEEGARAFLADPVNPRFSLGHAGPAVELASWTMMASQFINLDETISKP